jgi:Flp pilus assembly protein TadG
LGWFTRLKQNPAINSNRRIDALLDMITRFLRDNRGATAAMVAAALPVLIGFEALGVETGLWYMVKRQNQSAADAAAIAAAYEVIGGGTNVAGDLTPVVSAAAAQNGYTGTAPQIVYPYSDSTVANGVAVVLRRSARALFGSIFLPSVTIATKAVSVVRVLDDVCLLARATTGTGVEVDSASQIDASGCAVAANSTSQNAIDIGSSTGLLAATLVTSGEISLQGVPIDPTAPPPEFTLTSRPMIGAPSIADPYAATLTRAFLTRNIPVTRVTRNFWNATTTIRPALYTRGMSFGAKAVIDLTPGTYYLTNGDFSIASGGIVACGTCSGANGVTIIMTKTGTSGGTVGNVQISSGANITLHAPKSGTFSGLLFVQDPLATSSGGTNPDSVLAGGSTMKLTGLLYFPATKVRFQGNPGAICTLLIAGRVETNGNAGFAASGCVGAGLNGRPAVYTAALVE